MCLMPGLADGRLLLDHEFLSEEMAVDSDALASCSCQGEHGAHGHERSGVSRRTLLSRSAGAVAGATLGGAVGLDAFKTTARAQPAAQTPIQAGVDQLVMLGVGGGPILNRAHFQPATALIVNGRKYLVDCGSDTPHQIAVSGMGFSDLRHVFVTHHHLDHVAGIPALSPMGWRFDPAPLLGRVHFWGPPPLRTMVNKSRAAFDHSIELFLPGEATPEFPVLRPHELAIPRSRRRTARSRRPRRGGIVKVMEDANVRVYAARVFHGPTVPDAFAYRFHLKRSRKVVVFSGDRGPSSPAVNRQFIAFARDADVLVHEVLLTSAVDQLLQSVEPSRRETLRRNIVTGHTEASLLPAIAKAADAKRIVMSHYSPAFPPPAAFLAPAVQAANQIGYTGEIVAATDLHSITL